MAFKSTTLLQYIVIKDNYELLSYQHICKNNVVFTECKVAKKVDDIYVIYASACGVISASACGDDIETATENAARLVYQQINETKKKYHKGPVNMEVKVHPRTREKDLVCLCEDITKIIDVNIIDDVCYFVVPRGDFAEQIIKDFDGKELDGQKLHFVIRDH
jgi:hypothetical protein